MKKPVLNKKGSLLLGNTIALIILGTSVAGLIYYTSSVQNAFHTNVKSVEYKPLLKQEIINNLKSLLIEKSVTEAGEHEDGICSLVVSPAEEHGVTQVNLDLSLMENDKSWSRERWEQFFPSSEWTFIDNDMECQKHFKKFKGNNNLHRCLKYTGSDDDTVYAIAQIIPKSLPTLSEINISDPTGSVLDSKKVVFYLRAELTNPRSETDTSRAGVTSTRADMIWANDVGECYVKAQNGKYTLVRFAGTGLGSSEDKVVVNSPYGHRPTSSDGGPNCPRTKKLKIGELDLSTIQVGSLDNDNRRLRGLSPLNVRVSCTTHTFKCKKQLETGSSYNGYDEFTFNFQADNPSSDGIHIDSADFTFKKSNGKEWDGTEDGNLDQAKAYLYLSDPEKGLLHLQDQNMPEQDIVLYANIKDTSPGKGVSRACHAICQGYEPGKPETYFYPALQIKAEEGKCLFQKDFGDNPLNRVHCTVCYTKACHRYGLGTFGPFRREKFNIQKLEQKDHESFEESLLDSLLNEALDSQLPECAVQDKSLLKTSVKQVDGSSGNCLTMDIGKTDNLTEFNSSGLYSKENCDTELPVLCFAGGQYRPAKKITIKTDGTVGVEVVIATYQEAQKRCFEMGRERGKAYELNDGKADGLAVLMLNMWGREPAGNNLKVANTINQFLTETTDNTGSIDLTTGENQDVWYDFINNTIRGMFLAPPSDLKVPYATNRIRQHVKDTEKQSKRMWVAMEVDEGGFVVATPPYAGVAKKPADSFALYFGKETGNPITLLKDTSPSYSWTGDYLTLAHNIRWKGLMRENNKTTQHPFLCQKSDGSFFITQAKDSLDKGVKKCEVEGGRFLPPLHSGEWAQAMLQLNQNDSMLPFPDPLDSSDTTEGDKFLYEKEVDNPKAWVALKLKSGFPSDKIPLARDMRLAGHFAGDSFFFQGSEPAGYNGVIDHKGKKAESASNMKKVCSPEPGEDNSKLRVIGVDESCDSKEQLVTAETLKKQYKSLWFMSQWVSDVPSNQAIVIDAELLKRACKENCETQHGSCREKCPADNPQTPTNENQACLDECDDRKQTCSNQCE